MRTNRLLFFLLAFILLTSRQGHAQNTSFFQSQFNGGVTACGYGPEYDLGGTGNLILSIAPGSTIYKAWLFAGRQGVAPSLTVTLNGTSFTFDNTNQVSTTFQSPSYGGNSAVHAIDVSSAINPALSAYNLVVPNQAGGPTDRFQDFYLYVAYANPTLPQMTTCIFLNSADCQQSTNDVFNFTYPVQNVADVGMELFFGYACDLSDGETVVVNGTTTGTVYGPNSNSGYCAGPFGDFAYQNGTLSGILDGNPDQATNGPDAISNIKALTTNCADSVTATFSGGATSNALWGFFFTYTAIAISTNTDTTVCSATPVQLNVNTSGGTVSWSPTTGLSCTTCSNPIATPTVTTQYIATVTSSSCNPIVYDTATINIGGSTGGVTVNDTSVCGGQAVTLTAHPSIPGGTYAWMPGGATTQSITVHPASTTEYYVTYVSTCGTAEDSATVSIGNASSSAFAQSICSGASYTFGGHTLTMAGTYYDTLQNATGCDSIITLTLSVLSSTSTPVSQSICSGSSYNFYGHNLTTSGMYRDTLTNVSGCDSIIVLTLGLIPPSSTPVSQSICSGSSYNFYGQNLTTAGTYSDTLTTASGCDSIIVLTLGVVSTITTPISASSCTGSYIFNGQTLTTSGTYSDTLPSVAGCDSITVLTLTVGSPSSLAISQTICDNGTYPFKGQNLNTPGTYTQTLTGVSGCDSTVTLTLSVLPTSTTALSQSICSGSTYNFNGQTLTTAGTYIDTMANVSGCDSIITLTLSVVSVLNNTIAQTICSNTTTTFHGQTIATTGTYSDTMTSAGGCDSITTLTLTVLPIYTGAISQAMFGGGYTFGTQVLTASGIYIDTLSGAAGCDSIITLTLSILQPSTDSITATICGGKSYVFNGQTITASGIYRDTFTNAAGCDSFSILNLMLAPQPVASFSITPSGIVALGSAVTVTDQSTNADSILWQLNTKAISLVSGSALPITDTGTYCLREVAMSALGCSDTSQECITVYNNSFYLPNAFTPNNDGKNDYISLYGYTQSMKYLSITVFDRWGEKVFESNDINFQWDGTYRGVKEAPGIYVYTLNITFLSGTSVANKGSITLIR
jgi:gliding motility-associated-like protein